MGWSPTYTLKEGLPKAYKDYAEQRKSGKLRD